MIPGKVNIVIPLFNQEQFIAQCLRSCLAQTYTNFDVTVVNDGSTDRSLDVVLEVIDEYTTPDREKRAELERRIKEEGLSGPAQRAVSEALFPNGEVVLPKVIDQENVGLSESRNRGIRAGDGEFILPLDSDDWIDPRYLELTVPKMADQKVGIVATDMQYEGLLHHRIRPRGLTLQHEMQSNDLPVCSLIRRTSL